MSCYCTPLVWSGVFFFFQSLQSREDLLAIFFTFLPVAGGEKNHAIVVEECVTGFGAVKAEKERIRMDDVVES